MKDMNIIISDSITPDYSLFSSWTLSASTDSSTYRLMKDLNIIISDSITPDYSLFSSWTLSGFTLIYMQTNEGPEHHHLRLHHSRLQSVQLLDSFSFYRLIYIQTNEGPEHHHLRLHHSRLQSVQLLDSLRFYTHLHTD